MNYTNLSLNNITGPVTLTGSNDVTNLSALRSPGPAVVFSFNDVDDITLTSVGGVNGISTSNGAISITTANGPIIVVNTAVRHRRQRRHRHCRLLSAGSFGATDFSMQLSAAPT